MKGMAIIGESIQSDNLLYNMYLSADGLHSAVRYSSTSHGLEGRSLRSALHAYLRPYLDVSSAGAGRKRAIFMG